MKRAFFVWLVSMPIVAWAQSPCDGKITSTSNMPMDAEAVSKPAPGESYIDPVFGTLITRITNTSASEGSLAVRNDIYSTMRGWNADDSLIIIWHRSGSQFELYEGDKPYSYLCSLAFDTGTSPADIEQFIWDDADPDVFYYPSGYTIAGQPDPRLIKGSITSTSGPTCGVTYETLHVFDSECAGYSTTEKLRLGADPHDQVHGEAKLIGLTCGETPTSASRHHMLYSITDDVVVGSYDSTSNSAPWVFPNGNGAYSSRTGVIYDATLTPTGSLSLSSYVEHSALAERPDGKITYNAVSFANDASLMSWDLATGTGTVIIGQSTGWPTPKNGTHISLGAADGSGWVAVSTVGNSSGASTLDQEIDLGNVQTGEVCRIAHHRSFAGQSSWGYWGEPHPQLDSTGYRILFNSDFLGSSTVEVFVADLRPQDTTILTSTLANGVTTEAYSKALSIAGGTGTYACTLDSGSLPSQISLGVTGNCTLAGTPDTVESQMFTIQACDSAVPQDCTSRTFTLETQERPEILTGAILPTAIVGSPYQAAVTAQKGVGPYLWEALNVPPCGCGGMALNAATWEGSPITLGACAFDLKVTDSHPTNPLSSTKTLTMPVVLPSGGGGGCPPCAPSAPVMILETK